MVALNSSRRQSPSQSACGIISISSLIDRGNSEKRPETAPFQGSRRATTSVEVDRDGRNEIINVRIGRWRALAASPQRRIEEVCELGCDRVAVRLSRGSDADKRQSYEIWQLYDINGRLLASLQTSSDGGFAMISDYESRQASQLLRNRRGELETVETWAI